MRKIFNGHLNLAFSLSERPTRIVSLVSSASEAMDRMGLRDRLIGVSEYCERYLDTSKIPVLGQYLVADIDAIVALKPDLVLLTTGVQRKLSERLQAAGLPVYNLPLPHSFGGILDNILVLGGLLNTMPEALRLVRSMQDQERELRRDIPERPKRVYLELWLGKHMRAVGGLSYIRDLVELAGGELVYAERAEEYFVPGHTETAALKPEVHLFFHEPEYLVDGQQLVAERGWDSAVPVLMSTVKSGENMIQDGPSILETAHWLKAQLQQYS